jgi:1-phosphatidylinositol phosphodiesterase
LAGFDLRSPDDRVLAFDFDGDGKQDLFLYRPGSGAAVVARSNGDGTLTPVYFQGAGGAGIAGFDLRSPDDRVLAFDFDGDGKQDLFLRSS